MNTAVIEKSEYELLLSVTVTVKVSGTRVAKITRVLEKKLPGPGYPGTRFNPNSKSIFVEKQWNQILYISSQSTEIQNAKTVDFFTHNDKTKIHNQSNSFIWDKSVIHVT